MCDRHHGLVPAEPLSEGLIRPRPQTQSLSHGLPELHVPVRGAERLAGAERLLEVEFHQPHVEFPQKQVSGDVILEAAVRWISRTVEDRFSSGSLVMDHFL